MGVLLVVPRMFLLVISTFFPQPLKTITFLGGITSYSYLVRLFFSFGLWINNYYYR